MASPRADRRLAAILAADVAGYSGLVERDEAGTLARLAALRTERDRAGAGASIAAGWSS